MLNLPSSTSTSMWAGVAGEFHANHYSEDNPMTCPRCLGNLSETGRRVVANFIWSFLSLHTYRCLSCKDKMNRFHWESLPVPAKALLRRT